MILQNGTSQERNHHENSPNLIDICNKLKKDEHSAVYSPCEITYHAKVDFSI